MAARVIDLDGAVIVGTREEIRAFFKDLSSGGSAVFNMEKAKIVHVDKPVTDARLRRLLGLKPVRKTAARKATRKRKRS